MNICPTSKAIEGVNKNFSNMVLKERNLVKLASRKEENKVGSFVEESTAKNNLMDTNVYKAEKK